MNTPVLLHRGERKIMRKVKSYSSVWKFERVLSSIGDIPLLVPATFVQIAWGVGTFFVIMLFLGKLPPLCYIDNLLFKYGVLPVGVAWFMSKKTFDGKKPYSYLRSVALYLVRPKVTYAGRRVKYRKEKLQDEVTIVRCYKYVPD